jgi:hypothetical protein
MPSRTLLLLLLALAAPAQLSGVYTIHPLFPTGSGNFQTIGAALAALHSQTVIGPTNFWIFDDAGPWTEANTVATFINGGTAVLSVRGNLTQGISAANPVVFEAAPGESPVFDASGQPFGVVLHGTQYVTVKGITIRNATSDGVNIYTDSITTPTGWTGGNLMGNAVIGCRIHDIGGCGINIYQNGGAAIAFEGTIIRNNFFWRCQLTNGGGNYTWRLGYMNERRSRNAIIENNTFHASTGVGSNFGVYVTWYAAPVGGPAASFRNNLIQKTVANGVVLRHVDAGSFPLVQNHNVYEDLSLGTFLAGGSGTAATFQAMQQAYPALDPNGLSGPVLLVNPAMGDLHLQSGSLAIDVGTSIAGILDDIDGQPRPYGPAYDAGADEWVPTGAAVIAYGAGCVGAGGAASLGANQLPTLGNAAFSVTVTQMVPGAPVYTFLALAPQIPPIPLGGGCSLHLEWNSFQALLAAGYGPFGPVPANASGSASFPFPIPMQPGLAGVSVFLQAAATDPSLPQGFVTSNGLRAILN